MGKKKRKVKGRAMQDITVIFRTLTLRYCSNYYSEFAEAIEVCDWCQSEERKSRHGSCSKKSSAGNGSEIIVKRSEYSGDKIKQQNRDETSGDHKGKSSGSGSGTPSPRPTSRRYKLLKDVMC
ncbi:hypothetical protein V6N11_047279 [Hibiscus sabdariffa]|uniref:Uncharacterized protein n=2 Tax=Hibiscus sabdariffa TaxID=183260 RepID=A0ABR2NC90_9ROSI